MGLKEFKQKIFDLITFVKLDPRDKISAATAW
jgi:hypothetical protein